MNPCRASSLIRLKTSFSVILFGLVPWLEPNDPEVELRTVAPARFAVVGFSGFANKARVESKTAELVDFAKGHDMHIIGPLPSHNTILPGPFGS